MTQLAAIQMRRTYGDVKANLAKAESLVRDAARAGAQLIVLPELFNTGYGYTPANCDLAESPDGRTAIWMTSLSAELDVHLAGAFLQRKRGEIFNTLLLAAPDGRTWTYDKLHPWGWERAYFRPGESPVIANTDLGKIGMLICYDVAHPDLFVAYAGKVQLLVVSSSPPKVNRLTIHLADGPDIPLAETGPIAKAIEESGDHVFDADLRDQAAWVGVPLVNAMPYGKFESPAPPRAKLAFGVAVLLKPSLWKWISRVNARARISADYNQHTCILDANGRVAAPPPKGDAFTLASVEILASPPAPHGKQPKPRLSPLSRWVSSLLSWSVTGVYRKNAWDFR
jgi:predicted amidohydrolase